MDTVSYREANNYLVSSLSYDVYDISIAVNDVSNAGFFTISYGECEDAYLNTYPVRIILPTSDVSNPTLLVEGGYIEGEISLERDLVSYSFKSGGVRNVKILKVVLLIFLFCVLFYGFRYFKKDK